MKCDEARPSCQRCVSTGRKCDGYTERIREPSSTISPIPDSSNAQLINLARSPSMAIEGSEREARSFNYFCQRTAPQLTGFCGDDFWDYLILRASHHEPAIRHAVIALGSLDERFIEHDGMLAKSRTELYRDDFALREYTVAVQSLVRPLMDQKQQSVDVCLIACILFTCFEVPLFCPIYTSSCCIVPRVLLSDCLQSMQGCYGSAITHIDSGSKLLLEIQTDAGAKRPKYDLLKSSAISYAPIDVLEGLFMRLKLQVIEVPIFPSNISNLY